MSLFKDVKDLAAGRSQSKDWYRSQVRYGLESLGRPIQEGDILFYDYVAQSARLDWYDMHPLTLVTDVDNFLGQFSGGNIHYLRPSARQIVGKSWAGGATTYPSRCYHKYFMSSASNIYIVPLTAFTDYVPLPLEQFLFTRAGVKVEVPSSVIWSRV